MGLIVSPEPASNPASFASAWQAFERTKTYDTLAALPVMIFYGLSIAGQIPALANTLTHTDLAAADFRFFASVLAQIAGLVFISLALVLLAVRRTPLAKAKGLVPRISAFGGAFLMVAVVWLPRQPIGIELTLVSLLAILFGVGFSIYALFHLGRSFSLMAEARRLVTDGPYARVRHPLYLGEAVSTLGLMLQFLSPLAATIVALQLAFQLQRMKNEERVLSALFPEYAQYQRRTARLLPGIY